MKKQSLNEQVSRIRQMMRMNEMFESDTVSRFMDAYGEELYNAVKKLRMVSPEMLDSLSEDEQVKLQQRMGNYDKNVLPSIEHMVNTKGVFKDDIVRLAIDNSDRFGTEPQFVIYAIDDFTDFFGIDIEEEDEID